VGLHVLNTLLVYRIVLLLTDHRKWGIIASVVFGCSYLTAEAVLWGEHTAVWMSAILVSVLLVARYEKHGASWRCITSLICLMAFVATSFHEGIIVLPVVLALYAGTAAPRTKDVRLIWVTAFLALIAICSCIAAQSLIRVALTGGSSLHLPLRLSSISMWTGVFWKVLTSLAFFVLTPWYQAARLGGASAAAGLLCACTIVGLVARRRLRPQLGPANVRTLVWLLGSAVVCLLPAAPLGADTNMPTMGGRYLYCGWGLVVIAAAVWLSAPRQVSQAKPLRAGRVWLAGYVALSLLLIGLAQSRFLQRSRMDAGIVRWAESALLSSPQPSHDAGRTLRMAVSGEYPLKPANMPTPDPGELGDVNAQGIRDMLRVHGVDAIVELRERTETRSRPHERLLDLTRLRSDAGG